MILIHTPNTAHSEQRITLDGVAYVIEYKFNVRNNGWYINLYNSSKTTEYISGVKLTPNQNLTGRYVTDALSNGDIWCARMKNDNEDLGRNNLGIDKSYTLVYFSDDELPDFNINDYIQL